MKNDVLKDKSMSIRYIKGQSGIVSGVKQKDSKKLESKGAIGGCGTYRTNTPAELNLIVTIDKKFYFVDIKNLIKNELGFAKFSEKRISILDASIPHQLDFKKVDNNIYLDIESESVKNWLVYLKKTFSKKWQQFIKQNRTTNVVLFFI